jgi:hypothetical protein
MAIVPPYIKLSNGDIITFEKVGPFITAVLSNSEGILIRKGNKLIGATEKSQADTLILGFVDPKPFIIEEVLTPISPQETPEQIQQRRQEKAAQRTKENAELAREQQNLKVVEQSVPENQKAKGSAKFGPLILKLGLQIFNQFQPQIISYITDLGLKNADKLGTDPKFLQDVLSGNIDPKILLDQCPPKEKLDQIIVLRNRLTNSLNGIGTRLDSFNSSLNAILSTYNISLTLVETLDIASKVTSLAAKFVPAPPGIPGIVTSTLNDLLLTKLSTLYTTDGSPKLSKLKAIFDSAAMPLTITSGYIKTAVNLLSLLDIIIKLCDPNANLVNVDDSLTSVTKQLNADNNDSTYKGFTFEIEEVPFSNNLVRKRALGLNKSGIKLIETQLSFTLDNQVLIEELKLIIDKGNLKAD